MGKNLWGLYVFFFKIKKTQAKNCTRLLFHTTLIDFVRIRSKYLIIERPVKTVLGYAFLMTVL